MKNRISKTAKAIIKPKRRDGGSSSEKEIDLLAKYSFQNMSNVSLDSYAEANLLLLGEFKVREDVKMYGRLPYYDDLHGVDLSNELEFSAISKRAHTGFPNPSWITLKHHIFNARAPKKSFQAVRKTQ